jgi:serine/threonine protein kinase
MTTWQTTPPSGHRLELGRVLGAGASGVVRELLGGDRPLAVKLAERADDELDRTTLTRLDHPGLVRIHAVAVTPTRRHLVMDLVDGVDLATWLAFDPVPDAAEVAGVLIGAACSLAGLHRVGLIHGDLQPANIMLARDGGIVVVDLDTAAVADGTALRRGTPGHRRPDAVATPAADLWALASVGIGALGDVLPVWRRSSPRGRLLDVLHATRDRPPPSAAAFAELVAATVPDASCPVPPGALPAKSTVPARSAPPTRIYGPRPPRRSVRPSAPAAARRPTRRWDRTRPAALVVGGLAAAAAAAAGLAAMSSMSGPACGAATEVDDLRWDARAQVLWVGVGPDARAVAVEAGDAEPALGDLDCDGQVELVLVSPDGTHRPLDLPTP